MKAFGIQYRAMPGIVALCLLTASAFAAPKVQVKLAGQNDVNVDRPAIQAAIDSAPGQDLTVKLSGTFQLDGIDILVARSNLVIKGDKSGALLQGKLGPDGLPIDDLFVFPNRGFLIESSGPLMNIEIKDMALTGFRSPVFAKGEQNDIHGVSIKNNSVENSFFGFVITGAVSDVFIANNEVVGATDTGITVFSTAGGQPSDIQIVDNYIADAVFEAVYFGQVSNAILANNFLATSDMEFIPVPFVAEGMNSEILVEGNTLKGGSSAAILLGNAAGFTLTRNCIRDGGTQGDPFFSGGGIRVGFFGSAGSGYEITDNSYEGNVVTPGPVTRDIWLASASNNNSVTEWLGTVVLNEGASNSVVLATDDGDDYCADD